MTRARDLSSILAADGSLNISTSVNLADNEKAYFGTSNDLQIYHDGSTSYVTDAGAGDLRLTSNGAAIRILADQINLSNGAGLKDSLIAINGGATTLYYDNAAKIATTSTGVDVTGTITSDGLSVDGTLTVNGTGGQITTDNNGFITSKQSLDVATAGGRFIGKSNRGELGQIAIEQTATGADGGYIRFSISPSGSTSPTERMRIDGSGNVGIGTSSPTSELHLHVSGASNGAQIKFDNDYGIGYVGQENNTSNNLIVGSSTAGITFYAANAEKMRIDSNGTLILKGPDDNSLQFYESGSEIARIGPNSGALRFLVGSTSVPSMIINSTGKVGIQETSPDAYLHVKGKASYTTSNTSEVSGLQFVRFQPNSSNEDSLWFHNSGNALGISAYTDAATTSPEHLTLQTYGGNVGIGTNNPTSLLHTQGNTELQIYAKNTNSTPGQNAYITLETATSSGGNSYLRLKSGVSDCSIREISNGLSFQTGTFVTERMRIDSSGRVTMPYQPSFSCYKNGIMTEASGNNRVENWTENHDQGGHLNNSTGRFTAPVSGKYFFTFSAMHSGLVTGDVQYSIYKNGAIYQGSNDTADGGNWDQCTVVTVVDMAVNDYVEPYAYSSTTSTRQIVYSGRYSGWHGYLIG